MYWNPRSSTETVCLCFGSLNNSIKNKDWALWFSTTKRTVDETAMDKPVFNLIMKFKQNLILEIPQCLYIMSQRCYHFLLSVLQTQYVVCYTTNLVSFKTLYIKVSTGKKWKKKDKRRKKISLWTKSAHMLCSVDTPSPPQRKVASLSV